MFSDHGMMAHWRIRKQGRAVLLIMQILSSPNCNYPAQHMQFMIVAKVQTYKCDGNDYNYNSTN
eukprot:3802079-Amphidinium_carterae.1